MSTRIKSAYIDPSKIIIPDVRVKSAWDPEEYDIFKSSIKTEGITTPLICVKDGDTFYLADGQHRLEEALLKGAKRVPIAYKEGTLVDAMLRNLYLNRLHGKTKATEEVKLIKNLYEVHGLSLDDIVNKTGLSRERIDQRLSVARASEYVREALDEELIGIGVAFHLSRLPHEAGQDRLLAEIMKMPHRPTTKWIGKIVDDSLKMIEAQKNAPPRDPIGPPLRTILCGFCGQRYSANEMRGVNLCLTCLGLSKDYMKELIKRRAKGETPEQILSSKIAELSM